MSDAENANAEFLNALIGKFRKVVARGFSVMEQMPELINTAVREKYDPAWLEVSAVNNRFQQRRFSTVQAAEMAGISVELLYAAEQDGRLPKPEYRSDTAKKVRAGYTVNHINHIQNVFGTAPRKPEAEPPAICGFLNLKGGSTKTTNCLMFAQWCAMKGLRVLALDTDPQGSFSFYLGKNPDYDVSYHQTFAPFLLEDEKALEEAGHPPGASKSLHYAIQKTYWNNIDIVPACMDNLSIDLELPKLIDRSKMPRDERIQRLRNALIEVGEEYDVIVIDGTPSLNMTTLNVVSACDVVFVPTPADLLDIASTVQFARLIRDTASSYKDNGWEPNLPDLRYFVVSREDTKPSKFFSTVIRKIFNIERGDVLTNEIFNFPELKKANVTTYSLWEKNPSDSDNRKNLKKSRDMYDRLYSEMFVVLWETCFEDRTRTAQVDKIDQVVAKANEAIGQT